MDCKIVQQNIDLFVDGLLTETDRQHLLEHAASCAPCQKAVDDAVRLKNALASLPEIEPPKGLAMSAIKKAKKKRPLFVYISAATAAAAAVIALVMVLTPGIGMNNATRLSTGADMDSLAAKEETAAAELASAPVPETGFGFQASGDEPMDALDNGTDEDVQMPTDLPSRDVSAYVYSTEEDFVAAEQSSYYKPAVLPEGAKLESISLDEESFVFTYSLADGNKLTFSWLDALEDNGLTSWLKESYGDLSELKFDGTYYTFAGQSIVDVYWEQDGSAFHAVVPSSWTAQDIATYCKVQFVEVQQPDEQQ